MKVALDRLRNDYEDALEETESRSKVIDELEKMVENLREKLLKSNKMEEKQRQLADAFKKETIELEKEIQDFKKENTKLSNISKRLNIQLSNTRKKHAVEKDKIVTNFREELKLVKKELGKERKEKVQSEKKLLEVKDLNANEKHPSSTIALVPTSSHSVPMPMSLPPTASNPLRPSHNSSADPPVSPTPSWSSTPSLTNSLSAVSTTGSKILSSQSSTIQELTRDERIARFEAANKEALKFMDDIPEQEFFTTMIGVNMLKFCTCNVHSKPQLVHSYI